MEESADQPAAAPAEAATDPEPSKETDSPAPAEESTEDPKGKHFACKTLYYVSVECPIFTISNHDGQFQRLAQRSPWRPRRGVRLLQLQPATLLPRPRPQPSSEPAEGRDLVTSGVLYFNCKLILLVLYTDLTNKL